MVLGDAGVDPGTTAVTEDEVVSKVAVRYGVRSWVLKNGRRVEKRETEARHVVVWLLRTPEHDCTFQHIARVLGLKNHASTVYAYRKIERLRTRSPRIAGILSDLRRK